MTNRERLLTLLNGKIPDTWEEVIPAKKWPKGMDLWKMIKKEMGEYGIVGMPKLYTAICLF